MFLNPDDVLTLHRNEAERLERESEWVRAARAQREGTATATLELDRDEC